jgi:hypothetical protein
MNKHRTEIPMKTTTRLVLALILGTFLFGPNGYCGDDKPRQGKPATNAEAEAAWHSRISEINLGDNLPLFEVVRSVLSRHFPNVNFVVPESARDTTVPRLVLRNVTLAETLKAMELASDGRIRGGPPTEPQAVDAAGLPIRSATDNSKGNIVTFSVGPVPGSSDAARQNPAVCRVFSLAPYLGDRSEKDGQLAIKQLYDAFAVAWAMLAKYDRDVHEPSLTIHEGTKLLIAVGRDKELSVIDSVIRQLQGSAPARRVATPAENEAKTKSANINAPPAAGTKPSPAPSFE